MPALAFAQTIPGKFMISDRVEVAHGPLRERATPDITGNILGRQSTSSIGTIQNGPVLAGGHVWWFVDYQKGPDGWSAQEGLSLVPPEADKAALIDQLQQKLLAIIAQINALKGQ